MFQGNGAAAFGISDHEESGIKLTLQQIETFEREGYLFFPSLFRNYDVALPWKDGTPEQALKSTLAA